MEKLSIFGSTGFVGSNFCKLYPEISFAEKRNSIIPNNDTILYLRGTTTNYNVFSNPSLDVKTNLLLFTETLKNIDPYNEFNLISSWFCENPKGFYSITKLTQEMLLESYCKTFNIPYKILRLSNVIGGDKKASNKKNALEFLIDKIKKNEDIEIYEGNNYRDFINIQDCCRAIKLVIDKGNNGKIYNIGTGESFKIGDLCEYCIAITKSKSQIKIIPTPKFHQQVQVKDYFMNISELKKLGFKPKYHIWETLNRLCQ